MMFSSGKRCLLKTNWRHSATSWWSWWPPPTPKQHWHILRSCASSHLQLYLGSIPSTEACQVAAYLSSPAQPAGWHHCSGCTRWFCCPMKYFGWFIRGSRECFRDCCTPGLLPVIGAAVKPMGTWFLCVGPIFIFPFWLLLVAMSLGLWSYARSKLIWWWGMSWPFWAMILLQFWAVFVCILFAIIYLVYVILTGGVQPIHSTKKNAKDLQVEQQALWNLQPQAVQEDFFLPVGQSGVETQQGEAHALEAQLSVAEDAHALEEQQIVPDLTTLTAGLKCQIVSAALAIQANYAVLQLFVIVFCRLLLHSDSEKNAVNAYKTTISERHIATYMDYLNSLVTQADAAVGFSALVRLWCRQAYAAWNVLWSFGAVSIRSPEQVDEQLQVPKFFHEQKTFIFWACRCVKHPPCRPAIAGRTNGNFTVWWTADTFFKACMQPLWKAHKRLAICTHQFSLQ